MFHRSLLSAIAVCLIFSSAFAKEDSGVRLYTLDCGDIKVLDANIMDQTDSYEGSLNLKASCYVIKHGDQYMLWDAGFNPDAIKGVKDTDMFQPTIPGTLAEALTQIDLTPADISKIGISHYHFDHIGQANVFKDAELFIGAEDFKALFETDPVPEGLSPQFLSEWSDGENVKKIDSNYDVFGDGSVTIIPTPGHTPGHTLLQVNLKNEGPVLLVGDLWHFHENYDHDRMPDFNTDAEETKASFAKIKAHAEELGARLVIQHDTEDFQNMPAFPAYLD